MMKLEEPTQKRPSKFKGLLSKLACCMRKEQNKVSTRKTRTKLSKVIYNKEGQDKNTEQKG